MKQKKKREYAGYDRKLYESTYKFLRKTIQYNLAFVEQGLSHEAIEQAAESLARETGREVSVNLWWNAAAKLALESPVRMKQILKGQKS